MSGTRPIVVTHLSKHWGYFSVKCCLWPSSWQRIKATPSTTNLNHCFLCSWINLDKSIWDEKGLRDPPLITPPLAKGGVIRGGSPYPDPDPSHERSFFSLVVKKNLLLHSHVVNAFCETITVVASAPAGNYQLHRYAQHDVHQDVAEVRSVGWQPGQHCLRSGFCYRATAAPGELRQSVTEVKAELLEKNLSLTVHLLWFTVSLFWKSSPISLRRWKMQLAWHVKSRRTKNWPTLRLPSLLLRWAARVFGGKKYANMKVEQASAGIRLLV